MDEFLSTRELGWVLGRSSGAIRRMIEDGEIEASRLPGGYRVPRDEVLRLSRETVEEKAGRKLSDTELERLIDKVIATDEERAAEAGSPMKPVARQRRKK
jgi:excisionase family DNA binding protein